jgi:phosphopantothenate synthetase
MSTKLSTEAEISREQALHIADNVMRCLSPEIEKMHYQSRDRNQCYLQSLLTEAKNKGNLAMELIYALEKHLNK